jgi:hypothetical protein
VLILAPPAYCIFRYRKSIKKRIEEIERGTSEAFKIHRDKNNSGTALLAGKTIRCLELDPTFVAENKQWNLMSLGQYLSTLRPGDVEHTPRFLKKELEVTIGAVLIQKLGRMYGAALLPVLGNSTVDSYLTGVSASMASWAAARILSDQAVDGGDDLAGVAFSIAELTSFINMNQSAGSTTNMKQTPVEYLRRGEVVPGISFYKEEGEDGPSFPSPFVLERDFDNTIADMEDRIRKSDGGDTYNPDDINPPPPTLINDRVLPDLYLGWGDVKFTHTKREILVNRLVAVLLSKLAHNYYKQSINEEDDLFEVHFNGMVCEYPEKLLQAFMHNGHTVEVCPRTRVTAFGAAFCVKEEDGSWSHIPLACTMRTGYERYSDNKSVFFAAPHGGLDVSIQGPLIKADLQFFVAIEGLCAFHSNHQVAAPWTKNVALSEVYSNAQALQAVRMAALTAVAFTTIATDMKLPFGGYGILGMCNDTAALIDLSVRGETNTFPLLSTGRYLIHVIHRFIQLKDDLKGKPGMEAAGDDIGRLIRATSNIESDVHTSPAALLGATKRYLATYPESFFQATTDSKAIMSEMAALFETFVDADA